jgi:hypothetical protein
MSNSWTTRLDDQTLAKLSISDDSADVFDAAEAPVNLDVPVDDGWDALEAYGWGSAKSWSVRPIGVV